MFPCDFFFTPSQDFLLQEYIREKKYIYLPNTKAFIVKMLPEDFLFVCETDPLQTEYQLSRECLHEITKGELSFVSPPTPRATTR